MITGQAFREQYDVLQNQWLESVIERKRHYVRYLPPKDPVDFVLVAKMTSIGKKDAEEREAGELPHIEPHYNLLLSIGDFILNYGAHRHLCKPGETYYLTDLGKCAIPPSEAKGKIQEEEFTFWYPKLLKELELVTKPTATIIAVGRATWNFLKRKSEEDPRCFTYRLADPILHWSKQTVGAAQMASTLFPEEWEDFQKATSREDLCKSAEEVLGEAGLSQYMDTVSQRIKERFRDGDKHYMFTYKKLMPLQRPGVNGA